MLPLQNRLKKRKEIEKVLKEGKTTKVNPFVLKENGNGLRETRFCFIVRLKSPRKSVIRNKLKRVLRGIVGRKMKKIKKGLDVVLITLTGCEKMKRKDIEENIDRIFLEANIYHAK